MLASGCAAELAIAPVTGAGVGALVGRDRRNNDSEVSLTTHVMVGAVLGFLVDAVAIAIAVNDRGDINYTPRR
ncbi:MAG TPA: hypothetical protein VHT91_39620 [Kofleriaceae bacterium]|nr:hypothetical protein [Kofleriaceae bacterium]